LLYIFIPINGAETIAASEIIIAFSLYKHIVFNKCVSVFLKITSSFLNPRFKKLKKNFFKFLFLIKKNVFSRLSRLTILLSKDLFHSLLINFT